MPLNPSDGIASYIKHFKKSTAPQFKDKNEKERRDMAVAAYLSAKNENHEVKEETNFQVSIEGLPMMFIGGMSPGEVKAKLRGIVKQPSMIKSVRRVTDAEVKKNFRLKAQGRDEDEEDDVEEQYKYDYGTPKSVKLMKALTPGQRVAANNEELDRRNLKNVNEISKGKARDYISHASRDIYHLGHRQGSDPYQDYEKGPERKAAKRVGGINRATKILMKDKKKRFQKVNN